MAKTLKDIDELADFDPEAPPEIPPDPLEIARRKRRIQFSILAVCILALIFIINRSCNRPSNPNGLASIPPGSPMVNLLGTEIAGQGTLEGPFYFLDTIGPRRIRLSLGSGEPEVFDLLGLSGSDYVPAATVAAMDADALKDRQAKMKTLQNFERKAIDEFLDKGLLYIIRKSRPEPDQPSLIYLLKPDKSTDTSQDIHHPNGQADLVNAWLLRQGKSTMRLDEQQPFYMKMLDCQLAAILEARKARAENRASQLDSLWVKFDVAMPMTDDARREMEAIGPNVQ